MIKKLSGISLLLGLALPSQAAFVLKQHSAAVSSDTNTAVTGSASYTGSTLIVIACITAQGGSDPVITDSSSNTWTHVRSDNGDGVETFNRVSFWYAISPTVSGAQTFTCTLTGKFPAIFVSGWSGNALSGLVDQQNAALATSDVSTFQPGNVTPGSINELVITVTSRAHNGVTSVSIDSGFTITDQAASGTNNYGGAMAYLIQTTATSENPTWTYTGALEGPVAQIFSFNPAVPSANHPLGIF